MDPVPLESFTLCGCFARQPIGDFFVGVIPAGTLCAITYTDTRRVDERAIEKHAGLNRPINPARTKQIAAYINTANATFPNSVIIAIESDAILAQTDNSLTISVAPNVAKIIDGQHRISGLKEALPVDFDVVVSVFVDLPVDDQATIFSTINLKQARVDKSLVYDLFDLSNERSPEKTCHEIVKALNFDPESPFYKRIKLLGRNPKLGDGTIIYRAPLSQAAFVKHLLPMISENPERDRDLSERELPVLCPANAISRGLIFCNYFVHQEDATIIRILTNYFNAVKSVFPDEWNNYDNPLGKTIGYGALMRLLRSSLYPLGFFEKSLSTKFFERYLQRAIQLEFTFDNFPPAGSGESKLYRALEAVVLNESDRNLLATEFSLQV